MKQVNNTLHRLNKIVIITGASSGIGKAAAKLFVAEGAQVILGARREAELKSLTSELNQRSQQAVYLAGDVGDEIYASDLVALAVDTFGGLDVAFNNAGILGDNIVTVHVRFERPTA